MVQSRKVEVIETSYSIGSGLKDDPVRQVTEYFTLEGVSIAFSHNSQNDYVPEFKDTKINESLELVADSLGFHLAIESRKISELLPLDTGDIYKLEKALKSAKFEANSPEFEGIKHQGEGKINNEH